MQAHIGVRGLSIDTPFMNQKKFLRKAKIFPIYLEIIFHKEKKEEIQQIDWLLNNILGKRRVVLKLCLLETTQN